jgi:hypothetical protein
MPQWRLSVHAVRRRTLCGACHASRCCAALFQRATTSWPPASRCGAARRRASSTSCAATSSTVSTRMNRTHGRSQSPFSTRTGSATHTTAPHPSVRVAGTGLVCCEYGACGTGRLAFVLSINRHGAHVSGGTKGIGQDHAAPRSCQGTAPTRSHSLTHALAHSPTHAHYVHTRERTRKHMQTHASARARTGHFATTADNVRLESNVG